MKYVRLFVTQTDNIKSKCEDRDRKNRNQIKKCIIPHKKQDVVLSQGGPRDDTANFDTCRILQRHHAVSLPQHGFLVGLCLQTAKSDKY